MSCNICTGVCEKADLAPLLVPELAWLWEQVARTADRRGDEAMTAGTLPVTIPAGPAQRSAARGLLPSKALGAKKPTIKLEALTEVLAERHPELTPGAVAAHAVGHRLAARTRLKAEQDAAAIAVAARLRQGISELPPHLSLDADEVLRRLSRAGWITRLRESQTLIAAALQVLSRLPEPGQRVDRRTLVPGDPHALDEGTLPSLILAIAGVSGPPREAWDELGVNIDDLVGGLIATGLHPERWAIPAGTAVTLPPRQLKDIQWSPPEIPGQWAFVTENPSVLAAGLDAFAASPDEDGAPPRLICTAGTPSALECAAVAALTAAGWRVAVRADFDPAGLMHVRALLDAAPTAVPWRMSAADYLESRVAEDQARLKVAPKSSPWDPGLARAMNKRGVAAYEEDLLSQLVEDVFQGRPDEVRT